MLGVGSTIEGKNESEGAGSFGISIFGTLGGMAYVVVGANLEADVRS